MDAIEQLKEDLRQGRIDPHRFIELLVTQQRQLEAARQRVEELERKLGELSNGPGSSTPAKIDEPFSVRAEEKRQHEKQQGGCKSELSRKGRRGRLTNADKLLLAERSEDCYPEGVPENDCWLSHTRTCRSKKSAPCCVFCRICLSAKPKWMRSCIGWRGNGAMSSKCCARCWRLHW